MGLKYSSIRRGEEVVDMGEADLTRSLAGVFGLTGDEKGDESLSIGLLGDGFLALGVAIAVAGVLVKEDEILDFEGVEVFDADPAMVVVVFAGVGLVSGITSFFGDDNPLEIRIGSDKNGSISFISRVGVWKPALLRGGGCRERNTGTGSRSMTIG